MGHFGEELRRERESRGVALETISEKTKVITRYLTALEDDNFAALPGGILSKGIVRGYARTVGLDEAVWVDRFMTASQEHTPAEGDWSEFAQNIGRTRPKPVGREGKKLRWTGLAILVVLLCSGGWAAWHYWGGHVLAQELQQRAVTSAAAATATATPSDPSQ
ncbi:MAG: helix-turn-helix domain-containing protein [Acidobacteriota bacterium]